MTFKKSWFFFLVLLLLISLRTEISFTVESQFENFGSWGEQEGSYINRTKFWSFVKENCFWDLEYKSGSEWLSVKSDLDIIGNFSDKTQKKIKFSLIFNASHTADYRLTLAITEKIKNHTYKEGYFNYIISIKNYTLSFDWTDITEIPNLIITHGIKEIDGENYFWFRIRRNNVPEGKYIELDPVYEDFTTYTEYDPYNHIIVSELAIQVVDMTLQESAYVYKDMGEDHFSGDFEHYLETNMTACGAGSSQWQIWGLWNTIGDLEDNTAVDDGLNVLWYGTGTLRRIYIRESYNGTAYQDFYDTSLNTLYYLTISRVSSNFSCKIYSDTCRTNLLDTISVTVHSTPSYQYIYGCQSLTYGSAGGDPISGYCRYLELNERISYVVARFTWNITNPNATQTILFNGTWSQASCGITSYDWTWGDGTPNGSGATTTHSYSNNGTYNVDLEITCGDGTDSFTEQITIGGGNGGVTTEYFFGVFILGIGIAIILVLALGKD